jgi:hypothetical protein
VVEQHTSRNLRACEAEELQTGKQAEIGGGQPAFVRNERREAQIDAAEHVGNEVNTGKTRSLADDMANEWRQA